MNEIKKITVNFSECAQTAHSMKTSKEGNIELFSKGTFAQCFASTVEFFQTVANTWKVQVFVFKNQNFVQILEPK